MLAKSTGRPGLAMMQATNQSLSARRAKSVVTYLIDKGIAPERLTSEGFGESQPLEDADTAEAYAKNRRVEIRIESWDTDAQ